MRRWLLFLVVVLCGSALATPPMPPRPPTPHAAQLAATLFLHDAQFLQALARRQHLSPLLAADAFSNQTRLPIDMMVNVPWVGTRPPASWAYELRRYVDHFQWQVIQKRLGTDEVVMTSDASFPLLTNAARIIHGAAILLVPNAGAEKEQTHAILFDAKGHLQRAANTPAEATAGVVRFVDAKEYWDVTLPYDGRPMAVTQFTPPDKSF
ncbi:MAG: alpha/beta fold hydrolase domain-containing protein [Candidatus Xenobia bacterium]